MQYRRAVQNDLPRIRSLLEKNGMPAADCGDHLGHFMVAEEGNEIVGTGGLELYGTVGLLRSIIVVPAYRGRGVASGMCRCLEEMAGSLGISRLYLLTESATGFFQRLGFSPVERSEAPEAIRVTRQFSEFCPASARLMCLEISHARL